jgi:hypothetical protein
MLSDPQVLTVNSVAKSMPRIESGGLKSSYALADGTFKLTVSHQQSKGRIRSMVRADERAIVADPLTSVNDYETLGIYVVIDRPEVGFSATTVDQLRAALFALIDTTYTGKIFGLES